MPHFLIDQSGGSGMVEAAFAKFGKFLIKARYFVLLFWIALAVVIALTAPSLSKVGTTDEKSFLAAGSPSAQVSDLLASKYPSLKANKGEGVAVFYRPGGLTAADREYMQKVDAWLKSDQRPKSVSGVTSAFTNPDMKARLQSTDGTTMLSQVIFSHTAYATETGNDVVKLRDHFKQHPAGLQVYVTGAPGIAKDMNEVVDQSAKNTTIATLILVIALLLIIYRSPVAPVVPLVTIGIAYVISLGILGFLAQGGWKISTSITAFLVVLIFGAGTDYCLFMISRFREELSARENERYEGGAKEAVVATSSSISTVITASASTVIIGFLGLAVASFGMIKSMGPSLAIGIGITLLAGLTLVPALMAILGDKMFWPFHARVYQERKVRRLSWEKISAFITTNAKYVVPVILVLLLIPCIGLFRQKQSFDLLTQLPKSQESVKGFDVIKKHFNQGDMMPVDLVISSKKADINGLLKSSYLLSSKLAGANGVSGVISIVNPQGSFEKSPYDSAFMMSTFAGSASKMAQALSNPAAAAAVAGEMQQVKVASEYMQEIAKVYPEVTAQPAYIEISKMLTGLGQPGAATDPAALKAGLEKIAADFNSLASFLEGKKVYVYPQAMASQSPELKALEGAFVSPDQTTVRSYVILKTDPYATASLTTIRELRKQASALLTENQMGSLKASVGGTTAGFADIQTAINKDIVNVMIIVTIGVMLVFMILLRSIIAPLYLMATVLLSYGATLGIVTLLFQDALGQNGILYMIPILLFVLLIALGADYNIFLSSRIREESGKVGIHEGVRIASSKTGGIITACGIILAGTFATLVVAPMQLMVQVGVAVAIGILLDTFIVRALLVPAIATLVGRWNWWPSKLGRKQAGTETGPAGFVPEPLLDEE
jgi:putative drug exporter of the RND superfamily